MSSVYYITLFLVSECAFVLNWANKHLIHFIMTKQTYKLHKRPYKSRFIAYSCSCTTTELSMLLTSCLTMLFTYCTAVYERNGKNLFRSIKNSGEILNKLKSKGFIASSLSTYDFLTLYSSLPHNLIKEKLTELIEQAFNRYYNHKLQTNPWHREE